MRGLFTSIRPYGILDAFFPIFALDVPANLKHVHEPLPSVLFIVHLDVLHEPREIISQHLLGEHARGVVELDGGLVALGTPVLNLPVELGSVGWFA
jgi:hypothetical protein